MTSAAVPLPVEVALKDYSGNDSDQHKFKVLMLRNIAHAAPYIHDGSCHSLEDAVRAMAK